MTDLLKLDQAELRDVVAKQCGVVSALARRIADTHEAYRTLIQRGANLPLQEVGRQTADLMRQLSAALDGIGASFGEDDQEWMAPRFERAQELWPQVDSRTIAAGSVVVPVDFVRFLLGSESHDGVWFHDLHPTRQGRYWWRNDLQAMLAAAEPTQ